MSLPAHAAAVKITARDDLGIRTIGLVYNRSDHSELGDVTIPLFAGPPTPPPIAAIGENNSAGELPAAGVTRTIDFAWSLAPLDLKPGTQIVVSAVASDYVPQTGTSSPRRITIITAEELEDRLAQRQSLIFSELSRILKMQQDARQQNALVERQFERASRPQPAEVESLRGEEVAQRQVRRSLVSPTEGVRSHIVALLSELINNRVDNSEMRKRMQSLAAETDFLDREALPAAEQALMAALKTVDEFASPPDKSAIAANGEKAMAACRTAVSDAGRRQEEIIAALARMLGDLTEWNSFRGIARDLAGLRRDQAELTKTTQAIGAQTLAKEFRDLTAEQQADLARVAGRQLDLSSQFDKLQQRMDQVAGEIKETDPFSADSIADAVHAARRKSLSGLMRDSGESVEHNRIGQALAKQAIVSAGLDEMADILANHREQELFQLVQKLRDGEQQLATLRREQADLRKRLKGAAGDHDRDPEQLQRSRAASVNCKRIPTGWPDNSIVCKRTAPRRR